MTIGALPILATAALTEYGLTPPQSLAALGTAKGLPPPYNLSSWSGKSNLIIAFGPAVNGIVRYPNPNIHALGDDVFCLFGRNGQMDYVGSLPATPHVDPLYWASTGVGLNPALYEMDANVTIMQASGGILQWGDGATMSTLPLGLSAKRNMDSPTNAIVFNYNGHLGSGTVGFAQFTVSIYLVGNPTPLTQAVTQLVIPG